MKVKSACQKNVETGKCDKKSWRKTKPEIAGCVQNNAIIILGDKTQNINMWLLAVIFIKYCGNTFLYKAELNFNQYGSKVSAGLC